MVSSLYSNFTAGVDSGLLCFSVGKYTSSQDKDEKYNFVFLFIDVIWLRPRSKSARLRAENFSVHLHLTRRTWV